MTIGITDFERMKSKEEYDIMKIKNGIYREKHLSKKLCVTVYFKCIKGGE